MPGTSGKKAWGLANGNPERRAPQLRARGAVPRQLGVGGQSREAMSFHPAKKAPARKKMITIRKTPEGGDRGVCAGFAEPETKSGRAFLNIVENKVGR